MTKDFVQSLRASLVISFRNACSIYTGFRCLETIFRFIKQPRILWMNLNCRNKSKLMVSAILTVAVILPSNPIKHQTRLQYFFSNLVKIDLLYLQVLTCFRNTYHFLGHLAIETCPICFSIKNHSWICNLSFYVPAIPF